MAHRNKRRRTWSSLNRKATASSMAASPRSPTRIIIRYVSAGVQTDDEMVETKKKTLNIPLHLQSVNRITNIPIVGSGLNYAETFYKKIKGSNSLVNWTLLQAESTLQAVVDTAVPAVVLFQGPLNQVDKIVCKSLDFVEEKIPSINLPPEMIYSNTKQYAKDTVSIKIVRPVLKRADSVKQIGNTVLASKYTAYAADTLDGALNVADRYVDKFLPANDDQGVDEVDKPVEGPTGKAMHTIHHADKLGRKLKRRLTQRTLALKDQSAHAVNFFLYAAEVIATDPKKAYQNSKEAWFNLSKDEPENQARPENLEQLVVLLARESARRVVHLINNTVTIASKVNRNVSHTVFVLANSFLVAADSLVKTVHLEKVQQSTASVLRSQARVTAIALKNLNIKLAEVLEDLAHQLDNTQQPIEPPKHQQQQTVLSVPQIKVQQLKAFHTNITRNRNGFENNSNQATSSSIN